MILKKQAFKADKKTNPLIGVLLFFVSIVLLILTTPVGFLYGFFHTLFNKGFRGVGEYCLKMAISIDQLGNVIMQYLLNILWIMPNGYKFGNRDETISSALGRNKQLNTLTKFGKFIDAVLDKIDPNHSLNSIDYYIEPSEQFIDKLAWIYIEDYKILSTRSRGKNKYYIPGGKRENQESDYEALFREIKEELQVELTIDSLEFIGVFEAQADTHKPGTLVRMTCYSGTYKGKLVANHEIEEIIWLRYEDKNLSSEVDQLVFEYLFDKGLLR